MAEVNKLTIKALEALKPSDKGRALRDGGGLLGVVYVSRDHVTISVRFTYQYRVGAKRREAPCGVWVREDRQGYVNGSKTIGDIRKKRDELRLAISQGYDPLAEQAKAKAQKQLEEIATAAAENAKHAEEAMQAEVIAEDVKRETLALKMDDLYEAWDANHGATLETHWRVVRRSHWRCHISPVIGSEKVEHAAMQAVMQHYDHMVADGKEVTARRVLALLKQVMAWGVERQYVSATHSLAHMVLPKKSRTLRADQLPENFNLSEFLAMHGEEAIGADIEDNLAGRALRFDELVVLLHDRLPRSTQALTGKHMVKLMLSTGIRASEAGVY